MGTILTTRRDGPSIRNLFKAIGVPEPIVLKSENVGSRDASTNLNFTG
jgi:hypothetical protein